MPLGKSSGPRSERALTLGTYLRTLRDAPKGLRTQFASRLFPDLLRKSVRSEAESCEFHSLHDYEDKYRQLAGLLGRSDKTPPPDEIAFLRSIEGYAGRAGTIHLGDCLFLTAFVSILAPSRAIEIGTLGGFSAAVIAAAIHWQHPNAKGILVETVDRNTHSLVEPDKPVGFLLGEMFPAFADAIRLHVPADSGTVGGFAGRDEIEFAFVDADHQHPRPLLDLVRLGPCLRAGAWVVFHDVRLGTHTAEKGDLESLAFGAPFGAEWFFQDWPFRKISGGNIGAVQIPANKSAMVPPALHLMDLPFEVNPGNESRRDRRALHQGLVELW